PERPLPSLASLLLLPSCQRALMRVAHRNHQVRCTTPAEDSRYGDEFFSPPDPPEAGPYAPGGCGGRSFSLSRDLSPNAGAIMNQASASRPTPISPITPPMMKS